MEAPDIVVPVRETAVNEQLRYALRTWAANLPHRKVWVVGYRPAWLRNVEHIPTVQPGTKYENTTIAVRAACEHPDVADRFLLMNDDFFVMQRQTEMPVLHRGPVREVERYYAARASGKYLTGMRETRDLLVKLGYPDPLSYELHVPLPVEKAGMLEALNVGRHLPVVHKRTLYGTLAGLGGQRIQDVKVLHRGPQFPHGPFLSTMPDAFANGMVGRHIRTAFFQPSHYEITGRR
ncbi:hypothetical protein [Streptomyces murinus]|uniref:hypothetical protein n=1 Tax=Streptomyces murinus TaxID=33900 RepID=UPI0018F3CE86|nr:hypothetical protein [Streptomyces murinus]